MERQYNKKKQIKFEREMEQESPEHFTDRVSYLDETVEKDEMKTKVYELLEKLEAKKGINYRIAIEQYYLQQKTHKEIGDLLHCSRSTVANINQRALRALNFLIKKNGLDFNL